MIGNIILRTEKSTMRSGRIKIWLCAVLGLFGFFLWGMSWFGYQKTKSWRTKKVAPLIEAKYNEAYKVCEKAGRL